MATKPNTNTNGFAVLEFNTRALILSPADAAIVFPILCRAELARRDWTTNGYVYRPVTDDSDIPTLRPLTATQYATMHLESE